MYVDALKYFLIYKDSIILVMCKGVAWGSSRGEHPPPKKTCYRLQPLILAKLVCPYSVWDWFNINTVVQPNQTYASEGWWGEGCLKTKNSEGTQFLLSLSLVMPMVHLDLSYQQVRGCHSNIGVHMSEHRFQKYPQTMFGFLQENTLKQGYYTVSHQIWLNLHDFAKNSSLFLENQS